MKRDIWLLLGVAVFVLSIPFLLLAQTSVTGSPFELKTSGYSMRLIMQTDAAAQHGAPYLIWRKSYGTTDAPVKVQDGNSLGFILVQPYGNTGYDYMSDILQVVVDGPFGPSDYVPTKTKLYYTPLNAPAQVGYELDSKGYNRWLVKTSPIDDSRLDNGLMTFSMANDSIVFRYRDDAGNAKSPGFITDDLKVNGKLGFFGTVPVTQVPAYDVAGSTVRSLGTTSSLADVINFCGTMANDLKSYGLLH